MSTKVELAHVHYLYNTGIFSGLYIGTRQKKETMSGLLCQKKDTSYPIYKIVR